MEPLSDIELVEQEARVVQLRKLGMTFEQIAKEVGYANGGGAYKAFQRACKRIVYEDVAEVRQVELSRLDTATAAIMPAVMRGGIPAINTLLKLMERRARLLGLDAPVKAQIEVNYYERDVIDAELERLITLLDGSETREVVKDTSETRAITDR